MPLLRLLILLIAALALPLTAAVAGPLRGVALVIGEANYRTLPALDNAGRDAQAIGRLLGSLGFEVTAISDRDARKLKRDLDNFTSDAEGADVALIFYSGHGIEAGGDNWLVPVDADSSALEDPAKRLVALGPALEGLKSNVPLVLVFLDACRSNPFPPGAVLKRGGETAAIAATGLGAPRGFTAAEAAVPAQAVGTLLGLAAAPGQAALDGPPGGDSPYTAALLRHLGAVQAAELGQVMRMVTEEVYLKTEGRQRPWVNESLTGLLYLGKPVDDAAGDDAQILQERRQLLLTISALSEPQRLQVEAAARQGKVPMDALYGLLHTLGVAVPRDPEALAKLLDAQAERLRGVLAEQQALQDPDPEIQRLSGLAEQALREGALETSITFWDRAKARYSVISNSLDAREAQLKARRLEGGTLLARAAEAHELAADYAGAAENYLDAFVQVAKWDSRAAWNYKRRAADAWVSEGDVRGDAAALDRAVALLNDALTLAPRAESPLDWGLTQNDLGNALLLKAQRSAATDGYGAAIAAMRLALEVRTREAAPHLWAKTQNNLALALNDLAFRTHDDTMRDEAIAAYRAALSETSRDEDVETWATLMDNLGNALTVKGAPFLEEAVDAHRAALSVRDRARVPLEWARSQINLGNALAAVGQAKGDLGFVDQSIAAYHVALEEQDRARFPQPWAALQYNIGTSLLMRGEMSGAPDDFGMAADAFRKALEVRRLADVPVEWAETQYNLGRALQQFGNMKGDAAAMREALAAYAASLAVYSRESRPKDWAETQFNIGNVQSDLARVTKDTAALAAAIAAFRDVLSVRTQESDGTTWADASYNLGNALRRQAQVTGDAAGMRQAVEAYRQALRVYTRARNAKDWADTAAPLAEALSQVGALGHDGAAYDEAITTFDGVLAVYGDDVASAPAAHALKARADTQYNFGVMLRRDALNKSDASLARQAVAQFRAALSFYTRSRGAQDWADTTLQLADSLNNLRLIAPDRAALDEAVVTYHAALEVLEPKGQAALWAQAKLGLSLALYGQGIAAGSRAILQQGRAEALAVDAFYASQGAAAERQKIAGQLALFDTAIAKLGP